MTSEDVDPIRSKIMRAVRRSDTGPELVVRKLLHSQGFRYRLHQKTLPGTPDIVLARHKTVIFVHGCFWHRHPGCSKATMPKTRIDFWRKKFDQNVSRDISNEKKLTEAGWKVLIVWQCQTKNLNELSNDLRTAILGTN